MAKVKRFQGRQKSAPAPSSAAGPSAAPAPSVPAPSAPAPSSAAGPSAAPAPSVPAPSAPAPSSAAPAPSAPGPSAAGPSTPAPSSAAGPSAPAPSVEVSSQDPEVSQEGGRYWNVDAIDLTGAIKKIAIKVKEVRNLPSELRIIVNFDDHDSAYGDAQALLAGFLGTLAADCNLFPIDYERWIGKTGIPKMYFRNCFDTMIKTRFSFRTTEGIARRYCKISMGKKWAAKRQSLWAPVSNSALSREEIISDVPNGIDKDQWARFIQYRLKPSTQELCRKNKENRSKQVIPHTGGSKANSRRRHEIFLKTGKQPSRAQLYIETHKRKDGSFINDAAMGVVEQIEVGLTQSTVDESQVSPFDTVGRVLGVERHGRVRCMGLGAVPTNTFKNSGLRLSSLSFSSSSASSSSSRQWQEKCTNLENAFKAYMIMKEGKIPEEMAQFFAPESHVNDIGSTSDIHSDESGSYNASNM